MHRIFLTNGDSIEVEENELEMKNTFIVCVDKEDREGLIIPLTSVLYVSDNKNHKRD